MTPEDAAAHMLDAWSACSCHVTDLFIGRNG